MKPSPDSVHSFNRAATVVALDRTLELVQGGHVKNAANWVDRKTGGHIGRAGKKAVAAASPRRTAATPVSPRKRVASR